MKLKQMNFLKGYQEYQKSQRALSKQTKLLIGVGVLFFLVAAGASAFLFVQQGQLQDQIAQMEDYIHDPNVLAKVEEVKAKDATLNLMNEANENLSSIEEITVDYPVINSEFISSLDYEGITIESLDYSRPNLSLTLRCSNKYAPAEYVRHLKSLDLFREVNYDGFSEGTGGYTFNVSLVFNGGVE